MVMKEVIWSQSVTLTPIPHIVLLVVDCDINMGEFPETIWVGCQRIAVDIQGRI